MLIASLRPAGEPVASTTNGNAARARLFNG